MSEAKLDFLDRSRAFWNPGKTQDWQDMGIDLVIDRREGYYLYDMDGHRLIDLHLNGGTYNLGHRNSELVQALCNIHPNILRRDVEKILDIIFFEITEALCNGKNIEIRGFGTYKIVTKKARIGRNPKNSKSVQISASIHPQPSPIVTSSPSSAVAL